jgi:hypothetical protein
LKALRYGEFIPILIMGYKDERAKREAAETEIGTLKTQMAAILARVTALENA